MLRSGRWIVLALSAGAFVLGTVQPSASAPAQDKVSFARDVLPILAENCFTCHGPDADARQAGLRLDTAQGAFADRDGPTAVVPGRPDESRIIQKITHPDFPMPPVATGKRITEAQLAILKKWIEQGASYDRHWAFVALPGSVEPPDVESDWPRTEMDKFVFARLSKEGLQPSPETDKARWLRRATYDITGLPPTPQETDRFLADVTDQAYEDAADRLLASEHFGERMATFWLDAARYADSYGYQSDLLSPTWPYRDWVVRAFNENLPYDEFLTWQLAGDLLETPTTDQRLATAFNRLHRQTNEGGSIALEYRTEYAADRVETFGTAMLGLTVGCARCHDHKFDPLAQKEYYELFAYFNSIDEYGMLLSTEIVPTPSLLLPTEDQETKLLELRRIAELSKLDLAREKAAAEGRFQSWLPTDPSDFTDLSDPNIPGLIAHLSLDEIEEGKFNNTIEGEPFAEQLLQVKLTDGIKGKAIEFNGDNGLVVRGLPARERWDEFTWSFWVKDPGNDQPVVLLHRTGGTDVGFCGFDLTLEGGYLTARVMRHWPGNAIAVRSLKRIEPREWTHVAWSWDGGGQAEGMKIYIGGHEAETRVLNDRIWKKINAYGDLGPSKGDWAFAQRFRDLGFKGGTLDEAIFAARALSAIEVAHLFDGNALTKALQSPQSNSGQLREYYLSAFDSDARGAKEKVRKAQQALAEHESGIYEISVMEESANLQAAYVLERGNYDAPRTDANRVTRGVPAVLPPLADKTNNDRLALARWLTRPDHPLTARVAVNRLWQMLFGRGLVETSENFGSQGTPPDHPELLDYLARLFVDSGWDVKALLKTVVLSATYRQSSRLTPELARKDPENRLLARGASYRLPAEMIRDTALAASGLLNRQVGGPPVRPYQPPGLWRENNTMTPGFKQSVGTALYRRSLYTAWKRTAPAPNMMAFDTTGREVCTVRRASTNTPMQALVLMNDVQFVEAARVLAQDVMIQHASDEQRIRAAFRRLAAREPDQREMRILAAGLYEQRRVFRANISGAIALIDVGDSKPDGSFRATELAAMTVTVQTIMNLDAVVWRR